jgi:hypothetical protein
MKQVDRGRRGLRSRATDFVIEPRLHGYLTGEVFHGVCAPALR